MLFPARARGPIVLLLVVLLQHEAARASTEVVLDAADAPVVRGTWSVIPDPSAAGGARLANPDLAQPRPAAPLANPDNYVELTFSANAGVPYRFWLRGRAQGDSYENDSVWIQFSDSVNATGTSRWRIGTTSATSVILEDCVHCGLSGWGWQDNGYGGLGEPVYFATSGAHTVRIQVREDGLSIDQIVLSAGIYFNTAPGAHTNDTTILAGGGSAPPSEPASLVRGPYLQQVGADRATIVWATQFPETAVAEVGSRRFPAISTFHPASLTGLATDYFQHEALATGLSPATSYPYRLFGWDRPITDGGDRLTTAPASGSGRVRFIAFGDSGTGSGEQQALSSRMETDAFDFALLAGDVAYGNSDGTGSGTYATYQAWFFDMYDGWLRRRPVFPSMGNHDSRESNAWGRAYLDLFTLPTHGATIYADHAERYYSFDYGPVHVVALDTERAFQDPARRAAQLAWLEADLAAAAEQPWKIAVFHRSPFSSGERHGSDLTVRSALAPIFERYGVQLSLSAHEHAYERSVPWRTGTDTSLQAVTYLVTGGGGGPLYPVGAREWTAVSASEHHYVRVTIDGCLATIEAIPVHGSPFDAHVVNRCAQALDAGPPSVSFISPPPGAALAGITTIEAFASDDIGVEKVDLWIDGVLHGIDRQAPYIFTWDTTLTAPGTHTLTLRAFDVNGQRAEQHSSVVVGDAAGGGDPLPGGWQSLDVGTVTVAGSARYTDGRFTLAAAGSDIWGTADAFHFAYQPLLGDGSIVARVQSVENVNVWTKAGVMIRESLSSGSAHAFMLVTPGATKGLAFQRRVQTNGASAHTDGGALSPPMWVRLTRIGSTISAYRSSNGSSWTLVGSDSIAMGSSVYVGLAVTSHVVGSLATATFDNVTVSQGGGTTALPAGWSHGDIGSVGAPGNATFAGSTFVLRGSGADIWGTADAFQFAYRPMTGNGTIVARVDTVSATDPWTKAGIMIRAALTPSSRHAMMIVSSSKGLAFQRRVVDGGVSTHTGGGSGTAPAWVKLERNGSSITASVSQNGTTWTVVGAETIDLPATVYVGLPLTSHNNGAMAEAVISGVSVTP